MKRPVLLFRLSLYAHPSNGPCRRNTDSFSPRLTLCISRGTLMLARKVPVMYVFNVWRRFARLIDVKMLSQNIWYHLFKRLAVFIKVITTWFPWVSPTGARAILLPLYGNICQIYPVAALANNQSFIPNLWLLVGMYCVITDLVFVPTNDSSMESYSWGIYNWLNHMLAWPVRGGCQSAGL